MKNHNIRKTTTLALLIALVIVLQLLGYVMPKLGPFGLSFVLVPVVIGAAFYGPTAGAILGAAFGIVVCVCSYNGLDLGGHMVWLDNPFLFIAVVLIKGILAGTAAGLVYNIFKRKNSYVALLLAAIICPIVNTGVFLLGMATFFIDVLAAWAEGGNIVGYVLSGIVLVNFVPELIINILLTPASQRILKVVQKN